MSLEERVDPAAVDASAEPAEPGDPPLGASDHPVVRRRRWPRVVTIVVLGLAALAAAAAGVAYWYAQSLVDRFSSGRKAPLVAAARKVLNTAPVAPVSPPPVAARPHRLPDAATPAGRTQHERPRRIAPRRRITPAAAAGPEVQTFLLIGSDTRGGEPYGRSDTMILARLDRRRHTASLLSLPRDLMTQIPGHGPDKLNAAYADGGPALAIQTVRDTFGVVINHVVVVDFRGFQQVVAKLGGVYLPVDQRYLHVSSGFGADNYSSIDLQPGYQALNGVQALSFVRYRHNDSDVVRAARQQLFLRELKRQLTATDHLTDLPAAVGAAADSITSDIKSVRTVWGLITATRAVPGDRIHRVTLNARAVVDNGVYYLVATPEERLAAVRAWAVVPPPAARRHATRHGRPPQRHVTDAGLAHDTQGRVLVASVRPRGWRTCAPSLIPPNAHWAYDSPVRSYTLAGHPAIALVGEQGPGAHFLWMETTWDHAPILAGPSETVRVHGRAFDLYWEGRQLRMVAFRYGRSRVWLTNTLRNDVPNQQLLAMAASCREIS